MKYLILVITAVIVNLGATHAAFASNELMEIRAVKAKFEIEKRKLVEEIAVNTIRSVILERDVEFIEDYAQGNTELDTILAQYPVISNGGFVAAVYAGAKFFNAKVVNPALLKQEAGWVVRLVQMFPKVSKNAAWLTGVVATAASAYYTVDRVLAYADLKMKTAEEVGFLYDQKRHELQAAQDAVVMATRELLGINHDLNEMNEKEIKAIQDGSL